jgi:hypothetical protein
MQHNKHHAYLLCCCATSGTPVLLSFLPSHSLLMQERYLANTNSKGKPARICDPASTPQKALKQLNSNERPAREHTMASESVSRTSKDATGLSFTFILSLYFLSPFSFLLSGKQLESSGDRLQHIRRCRADRNHHHLIQCHRYYCFCCQPRHAAEL